MTQLLEAAEPPGIFYLQDSNIVITGTPNILYKTMTQLSVIIDHKLLLTYQTMTQLLAITSYYRILDNDSIICYYTAARYSIFKTLTQL